MAIKKGISSPKLGMNRDTYPGELTKDEYVFALNVNIHSENGGGKVIVQNENSNVKCSGFKAGYKVVGHAYDQVDELTYFLLTNPTTGFSEIGVISSIPEAFNFTPTETTDDKGNIVVQLETPLEEQQQVATCSYTTLVSDYCSGGSQTGSKCLNFSIESPFNQKDIYVKHGKRGKTLWFSHDRNPMRYLQLDRLSIYTDVINPCDDVVTNVCLDCDKMRVFPLHTSPCITAESINGGGALRAGNYEITLAYSDILGNELTDYAPATNPVRIFDKTNNILDQTLLNYKTNQAIKVLIANLDQDFEFYRLAVIYTSGLDGAKSVFEFGVFPINQDIVTVYDLDNNSKIDSKSVFYRRPFYETAEGQTVSNGYMYYYGLTAQRTINLQPVVNLMGGFMKWGTYMAKETLYQDGTAMANYAGFMRNEVYPASIEFEMEGGYITPRFPFIARPPLDFELDSIETTETQSVFDYNPECFGNDRQKRWQFENTAEETDICEIAEGVATTEVIREVEATCIVTGEGGSATVIDTVTDGTVELPLGYTDIVEYVNTHKEEIITSSDPSFTAIKDILEGAEGYTENCTPEFGVECSEETTLTDSTMFAISVDGQTVTEQEADLDFTTYEPIPANLACNGYEKDTDNALIEDTDFITDYMVTLAPIVYEKVYKRNNPINNNCGIALTVQDYTSPVIPNNYYLTYKGELNTVTTLQQTQAVLNVKTKLVLSFDGTNGSFDLIINGTPYLLTFATDWTTTLDSFITTHGVVIEGYDVVRVGETLEFTGLIGEFFLVDTLSVIGDLVCYYDNKFYTSKLHANAIWFKVDFNGADKKVVQIGNTYCGTTDDNSYNSIRISAFTSCSNVSDVSGYGGIIEDISTDDINKLILLDSADFGGTSGTAYIAIDSYLRSRYTLVGTAPGTPMTDVSNTLMPPCGCFNMYQKDVLKNTRITFGTLSFGKQQTYTTNCVFQIPVLNNCNALPFKKGKFSYWESTETYPCNKELFDSSGLTIYNGDIPLSIRTDFENYYTTGTVDGQYTLSSDTDFRDKNIRHYKFPDNIVAPFMSTSDQTPGDFGDSVIYPIGFSLDPEVISAFLDIAVSNGLISLEERRRIKNYRIYRGDRRIHKSVVAKGILFDMYKYNDVNTNEEVFYPNYPLNTLGVDVFSNTPHPYNSASNNFFTFHSPDTDYADYGTQRPTLTRELYVDGYLFGKSANYFDLVEDYPTYSLLGSKAYTTATSLAWTEVGFEFLLQSSDWIITAATGGLSAPVAATLAVVAVAATGLATVFKAGEYRYKWLETFKNLGKPTNYAYYGAAIGYYNSFKPNDVPYQKLRGLTLNTYLTEGFRIVNNEPDHTDYKVNALQRERAVLLQTGSYPITYRPDYTSYDNSTLNENSSSRRRVPDLVGKSGTIIGKTAVPYASIVQYNPSQWGSIDSITWVHTGFCGNLESYSDCDVIFGGDIFISRHSLKRKIPHFRSNAFGLAPLTPFKHSDYFNINPPLATNPSASLTNRYFIDYEVNDSDSNFVATILYPGQKSYYNLDNGGNDIDDFYVKAKNKFYLYSYGIPHFLVESEINCNFRYAKREKHENFYPNIQDAIEFTQEKNVSIKEPNTYFYNSIYSNTPSLQPGKILPINYERVIYDKLNVLRNTIIYSQQDLSEREVREPWRSFKALDYFDFSEGYGRLISVTPIESSQILVRFENGFTIYGSIDPIRDKLTAEIGNLGSGGIFAGRPINFNVTDIGYAGTQHKMIISSEAGHLWADAKRGKLHLLEPNGKGLDEVSKSQSTLNASLEKWFKENLPFKILRTFPTLNVDNSYNNLGLTGVWDDRFKRFLITKLDYTVNSTTDLEVIDGQLYDVSQIETIVVEKEGTGWTYAGQIGNTLYFQKVEKGEDCPCITLSYSYNGTEYIITIPKSGTHNEFNAYFFLLGESIPSTILVDDQGYWVLVTGEEQIPFAYQDQIGCDCIAVTYQLKPTCDTIQVTYTLSGGAPITVEVTWDGVSMNNGKKLYTITNSDFIPVVGDDYVEIRWEGSYWQIVNLLQGESYCYSNITTECPFGTFILGGSSPDVFEAFSVAPITVPGVTTVNITSSDTHEGKPAYELLEATLFWTVDDGNNWVFRDIDNNIQAILNSTEGCPFGEYQVNPTTLEIFNVAPCQNTSTTLCPEGRWHMENVCNCIQLQFTAKDGVHVITMSQVDISGGRPLLEGLYGSTLIIIVWNPMDMQWDLCDTIPTNVIATSDADVDCPAGISWNALTEDAIDIVTTNCNNLNYLEVTPCSAIAGDTTYTEVELAPFDFSNDERVTPCSWTVGYNPYLKSWISYYSYKPNYYIGYNDYFQSGKNFGNEFGLWSHIPFGNSYQVFYGIRYPFIIEYPVVSQLASSQLAAINYWLDVRKYYNRHNFTDVFGVGFNKAVVYNSYQNSGLLELIPQETNNIRQNLLYPKHKTNSIEILQTEINGRWSFNYLYNTIKTERSGLPIWIEDCAQIEKQLDDRLLNYRPTRKDYLRGDYFLVRLIQDAESRFKFMLRWSIQEQDLYED